jgi:prepilin-type N-terminal cleavage/methylation domain-containing protein
MSAPATSRPRRRARAAGFTLIEVMMSLAIAGSALVAIFAMQESIAHGNGLGREMTTATANTRLWLERIRRDSLTWTGNDMTSLTRTNYLNQVGAGWVQPVATSPIPNLVQSPGADWSGNETLVPGDQHFCTAMRLSWIRQPETMRADVITWWSRTGRAPCASTNQAFIDGLSPAAGFRQVAASTVIRRAQ